MYHVYIYACIHIDSHINTQMHIYIYIYIQTYTHLKAYVYLNIPILKKPLLRYNIWIEKYIDLHRLIAIRYDREKSIYPQILTVCCFFNFLIN